jgi:hypothetical protein
MLRGAPVNESGQFDYRKYTRMLKHGTKDQDGGGAAGDD